MYCHAAHLYPLRKAGYLFLSSAVTIIYTRPMREKIDTKTIQADFDRIALLSSNASGERWNHNNHYHRFLLEQVPACCTNALEIG